MSGPSVSPALQLGTAVGAFGAAAVIAWLRFTGPVPMPPRSVLAVASTVQSGATLAAATESEGAWRSVLARDAREAGLPAPSAEQMGAKLVYRADETSQRLAPGEVPLEVAGLRLTVLVKKDDDGPGQLLVLSIANLADHDLAYRVVAHPQPGGAGCNARTLLPHDAMVVRRQSSVERSECGYTSGMALKIDRVESVEVDGLQSVYLSRVSPNAVGGDLLHAKAHRPHLPAGMATCNLAMSQLLRSALEDHSVSWRDLVDFYARHPCDSYRFPMEYRAFEKSGERPLPAVTE